MKYSATVFDEISTLLWQIRLLEQPIRESAKGGDPMDKIMLFQFQHKQRRLIEKLLTQLTLTNWRFQEKGNFIRQLTEFLEQTERNKNLSAAHLEPQWKALEKMLNARAVAA